MDPVPGTPADASRLWRDHQRLLRQTRRQPGAKRVHALRVSTRRLLARLEAAPALGSGPDAAPARRRLRKLLHATGPARDAHVQARLLAQLAPSALDRGVRKFRRYLMTRERRLTRELRGGLRAFERKLQRLEPARLFLPVTDQARLVPPAANALGHSLQRVLERQRSARLGAPADYHRWRVALKRFRFLLETTTAPGRDRAAGLRRLQAAQTALGNLRDFDLLLLRWGKFATRHASSARSLAARQAALLRRRATLTRRLSARRPTPAELRRIVRIGER